MNEQTAVEWLMQQLKNIDITHKELFEQAKEMEKEQIRDAFNSGMNNSVDYFIPFLNPNDESENYYNETFKSE
jgi:hypothetical protein